MTIRGSHSLLVAVQLEHTQLVLVQLVLVLVLV
jgi:hypothetical protein